MDERDLQKLRALVPLFAPDKFLRQVEKTYSAPAHVRREATRRLKLRLRSWNGTESSITVDDSGQPGTKMTGPGRSIDADEVETIIVRALSSGGREEAQFTITLEAAVFSTHNFGWTKNKVRVPVAGLSPLIDEAVRVFHQMSAGRDGRILFMPDSTFVEVNHKSVFLRVNHAQPPTAGTSHWPS